jgi:hypothetical protein
MEATETAVQMHRAKLTEDLARAEADALRKATERVAEDAKRAFMWKRDREAEGLRALAEEYGKAYESSRARLPLAEKQYATFRAALDSALQLDACGGGLREAAAREVKP